MTLLHIFLFVWVMVVSINAGGIGRRDDPGARNYLPTNNAAPSPFYGSPARSSAPHPQAPQQNQFAPQQPHGAPFAIPAFRTSPVPQQAPFSQAPQQTFAAQARSAVPSVQYGAPFAQAAPAPAFHSAPAPIQYIVSVVPAPVQRSSPLAHAASSPHTSLIAQAAASTSHAPAQQPIPVQFSAPSGFAPASQYSAPAPVHHDAVVVNAASIGGQNYASNGGYAF